MGYYMKPGFKSKLLTSMQMVYYSEYNVPEKNTMLYITDRNLFNKVVWETEASPGKRMQLEKCVSVSTTLAWHKFHFDA